MSRINEVIFVPRKLTDHVMADFKVLLKFEACTLGFQQQQGKQQGTNVSITYHNLTYSS
jgi:hypothetical protein